MDKIWMVAKFLDQARWGNYKEEYRRDHDNYYLINEYSPDMDDDARILSHYITYCVNRQTPFKLVFDLGGFIFSDLVSTLQKSKSLQLLNPQHPDSYFIPDGIDGFVFQSHEPPKDNQTIILNYEIYRQYPNKLVRFKPRFYPRDYMSILNTFVLLEPYNFRFSGYLTELMERFYRKTLFLKRVLFGLHLMSYRNIGQFKKADCYDFDRNVAIAIENRDAVRVLLDDSKMFERAFESFQKNDIYHQKRLWCSLRDYLKCGYYRNSLIKALQKAGCSNFSLFEDNHLLNQLELPGDVWNNNPRFWGCILQNTDYAAIRKDYNRHLRRMLLEQGINDAYPEQFDFTFEFVSRMCNQEKCSICIFRDLQTSGSTSLKELCICNPEKTCPVVMHYCDYRMSCKGRECELLSLLNPN